MRILSRNYKTKLTKFLTFNLIAENIGAASFTYFDAVTDVQLHKFHLLMQKSQQGCYKRKTSALTIIHLTFQDEPVECPDRNELLQVMKTFQRLSLFTDKDDTIQSYANHIGGQID